MGLAFVKGRALSVMNAATLQILGMPEKRLDIGEVKHETCTFEMLKMPPSCKSLLGITL